MNIGIIGAGAIGQAFAKQLLRAGYTVTLSNSRGPSSLASTVKSLGEGARAGSIADAADAPIVILSVPWQHLPAAVADLPPWQGRIVIDAMNPIVTPGFRVADLGGRTSSEIVADLLPGAHLVKAGNTLRPEVLAADPHEAGGKRVLFLSGDDENAKSAVAEVLAKVGFSTIDLGDLATGGRLQQFPTGPLPGLNLVQLP